MKKIISLSVVLVMLLSVLSLGVSAEAIRGEWQVDGTSYTCPTEKDGNNFNYYALGTSDDIILMADVTLGLEHGFMFAVKDCDGDGIISEVGDEYYLVDITGTSIGIERNLSNWGGWAFSGSTGKSDGDTITLKVQYYKGAFIVFADDVKIIEWVDEDGALDGTGYGLCSKSTVAVFDNVKTEAGKGETPEIKKDGSINEGDNGGAWTVDGSNYSSAERMDWPNFSVYGLGNNADNKKMSISAKITVGSMYDEPTQQGGDLGFIVGVADMNENGKIEENGDIYYLIDIMDNGSIGIERNYRTWGGWAQTIPMGLEAGEVVELTAIYDPAEGHIVVYLDGEEMLDYTDDNPLQGTGYALASKVTECSYENVTVKFDDDVTIPEPIEDPDEPVPPVEPGTQPGTKAPISTQPTTTTAAPGTDPNTSTTGEEPAKSNTGLIIGLSCAGVAVIAAIVAAVVIIKKKKQ